MFIDELQLEKKMIHDATVNDPDRDISYNTMIAGILSKKILPDSTVLGFTRSGDFLNKELLNNKSEVFSLVDLTKEDVETMMMQVVENPEQRKAIEKHINSIATGLQTQILFVKEIIKISLRGTIQIEDITSATDLFLSIILSNLQHQNPHGKTGYSQLSRENKENLKKTFELCKENLKKGDSEDDSDEDSNEDRPGVFKGDQVEKDQWQSDDSGLELPLKFLKDVGIFEVPPSNDGEVPLTAQHLSFVEFFASAGILLSSDIGSELGKIENRDRFRAVVVYMRN